MPKKKVKRKTVQKKVRRVTRAKPVVKAAGKSARPVLVKNRIGIVLKNLLFFLILFVLSVLLGSLFKGEILDQLFWILAILTGFVSAAFLIVLLILLFMRAFKK
ncbi:MAG: hypothetical protein KKB31_07125 [Nanoarchaeota archaeon]|nr:hypothetical protein [Nanoarchaeota archaeon]